MVGVEIFRLKPRDFNSYGSRRGNDDVMARGTFANIRLMNKFIGKAAPKTVHVPSKEVVSGYTYSFVSFEQCQIHDCTCRARSWTSSMRP